MPAFDPKDHGWLKLFQYANEVTLPEQLTKKWWDKKKSVVAKMTRATGVGETLDALQEDFKKLAFPEFNPHPTLVEIDVNNVKTFISSPAVKKFHDSLRDLNKLALDEAKELKKNPLTKGTSKVLEEIAEVADKLMVCMNTNSLTESLRSAMTAWQKGQAQRDIRMAPTTLAAAQKVREKVDDVIRSIKALHAKMVDDNDEAGRNSTANAIRDLCRDMTQPLGNLIKMDNAGVGMSSFNCAAFDTLTKQMVPISNSQGPEFATGLSKARMAALVKKIEDWAREYSQLVAPIKIVKMPNV